MREMEEFENHKRSSPDAQPLSLLELYDGKGWRKDISPSGIDQSDYGDCGFLAALGAVAGTAGGQTTIKDMIKPNSDGSCTVTFPGDPGHPVTVDRSEYRNYHLSNSAKWANVVECAYLKYLNDGEFPAEPGYRSDHGVPKYAPGAGAKLGLSLLTGKNVTIDQFAWTDAGSGQVTAGATSMDNVAEDLAKALAQGEPVVANASYEGSRFFLGHEPGQMVGGHGYTVLSFDRGTDTVVVRNPWGNAGLTTVSAEERRACPVKELPDGQISMKFSTFSRYFSDIMIAGPQPYANDFTHTLKDLGRSFTHRGDAIESLLQDRPSQAVQNFGAALTSDLSFLGDLTHTISQPISDILTASVRGVYQFGNTVSRTAGKHFK